MSNERQELIEARETMKRQIEIPDNPIRFYDTYPRGLPTAYRAR
jgi:hypothetical protein